jgi:hypothetical protein
VHELPAEDVKRARFDCVLYQSRVHWLEDAHEILSAEQRRLPRIYLEHDPPLEHPTEERHVVDDKETLLVHVTAFNALMWASGRTPTCVIDHGVRVPDDAVYSGKRAFGLTAVNNIRTRGRRTGADILRAAQEEVPIDLVGMDAPSVGGLGEVSPPRLPAFMSRYRFYFNPCRYTSLNLAVIEAMAVGLPVVGLATTEMVSVVQSGVSGYLDNRLPVLVAYMKRLLNDPALARRLGDGARRQARARFSLERFAADWDDAFQRVAGRGRVFATATDAPRACAEAAP